jgi:hypothetical protein
LHLLGVYSTCLYSIGSSAACQQSASRLKNEISKIRENAEGKNRPVATNFQFLKMLYPSGTALLQRSRIFEVFLLGRACPKPCC